ncbi:MAG: hypothetical protein U0X71_07000 [Sphingobacteriaceae bacterium]
MPIQVATRAAFNAGTVLMTTYISGNVNYAAASISQVLTINKGSQTLTISQQLI